MMLLRAVALFFAALALLALAAAGTPTAAANTNVSMLEGRDFDPDQVCGGKYKHFCFT